MIDIKRIRENTELLRDKWKSRGLEVDTQAIVDKDKDWRQALNKVEELKSIRNSE